MKYVGSKARHSKHIIKAILNDLADSDFISPTYWIEPFVGGSNMIENVPNSFIRLGFDVNPYVITLSKAIQSGWVPPTSLSFEEYKNLKQLAKDGIINPDVAFAGFCCSFGAKWFGGYARGNNSSGSPRNYCLEQQRALLKQASKIDNVVYTIADYREIVFPEPRSCIIYCDPPYANTQGYQHDVGDLFWDWTRSLASIGHYIYVSEYTAPSDFTTIWSRGVCSSLDTNTGSKKATEKIFRLESA